MSGCPPAGAGMVAKTRRSLTVSCLVAALAVTVVLTPVSLARAEYTNPYGVAVIIGNRAYANERVPEVAYAHRDAEAFRRYVLDVLGFDPNRVFDLRDATQAEMFTWFGNRDRHEGRLWRYLHPRHGSDVVVFYSGHGVPGLKDRRGYLLPSDAEPDTPEINGYPIDLLYANLGKPREAKTVRVFLDACFSGDSDRGMLIRSASPVFVQASLPQVSGEKLMVLSAASGTEVASWDEKARHGMFTHHLLNALYGMGDLDGDGEVTAAEAKTYLDDTMTIAVRVEFGRYQHASLNGATDAVLARAGTGGAFPPRRSLDEGASSASPSSPSSSIERDKSLVGMEKAFEANDYAKVLEFIGRLEALGGGVPAEAEFFRGEAEFRTSRFGDAVRSLMRYVETAERDGPHYRRALERLLTLEEMDDAAYAQAVATGTPASFEKYLDTFPEGRHAGEARGRESALRAEDARRREDEAERRRVAEGRRAAERRADDEAFATARRLNTPESYRAYLARGGRHGSEARGLFAEAVESEESGLGLTRAERVLVQHGLASLGEDVGVADGVFGKRTRAGIASLQRKERLAETGYLTDELRDVLVAVGETQQKSVGRRGGNAKGVAGGIAKGNGVDRRESVKAVSFSGGAPITTHAEGVQTVFATDLDGDGDDDVLSTFFTVDTIAWYENLGIGAFSARRVISTDADGPIGIHTVDLDGDGDPDVLSASYEDDTIGWYENLGVGEFSNRRVITADADGATWVHAADVDADGDPDVLSASQEDDTIGWYENLGGGEFSNRRVITADADGANFVHAADVDVDGDPDVLSASSEDDTIGWYENLGGGEFSNRRVITTDADGANFVHAADVDADGDPDVLSASFEDDTIGWYENFGGGVFSSRRDIIADADGAIGVYSEDLDADGDPDVLSASYEDDTIGWHENLGGGLFSGRRVITADADGASWVHAADLDADGDPDVIAASWGNDAVVWYENLDVRAFSARRVIAVNVIYGVASAADLDGDGDLDVLSNSHSDRMIAWYENLGDGAFSEQRTVAVDTEAALFVTVADLDRDGDPDLLSRFPEDDTIGWYENLGAGEFSGRHVITTASSPGEEMANVPAADLDGDGDLDVLFGALTDRMVVWCENLGGGAFSGKRVIAEDTGEARLVHAADVDGDGDLDVVVNASDERTGWAWYENLGGGDFAGKRFMTGDTDSFYEFRADLDGDGDPDVISASQGDDLIAWYENLGGGAFSARRVIPVQLDKPGLVYPADLDEDGDPDLLSTSINRRQIAWSENLGSGAFSGGRVIEGKAAAWSPVAADLDGDGDLDVLSALGYPLHLIAWYENVGADGDR